MSRLLSDSALLHGAPPLRPAAPGHFYLGHATQTRRPLNPGSRPGVASRRRGHTPPKPGRRKSLSTSAERSISSTGTRASAACHAPRRSGRERSSAATLCTSGAHPCAACHPLHASTGRHGLRQTRARKAASQHRAQRRSPTISRSAASRRPFRFATSGRAGAPALNGFSFWGRHHLDRLAVFPAGGEGAPKIELSHCRAGLWADARRLRRISPAGGLVGNRGHGAFAGHDPE